MDLSCASGGAKDVKKQADTPNHRRNEQSSKRKCIDMALKFKVIPHKLFLKLLTFLSINERISSKSGRTILFTSNVVMDCRI